MSRVVFLAHVATTLAMVGIIWFVQLVNYPSFARVPVETFAAYEARNIRLTALAVGPLMAVEAATGLLLLRRRPPGVGRGWCLTGAALLGVLWLSTAFVQFPLHLALGGGFDAELHRTLMRSNWVRTLCWTGRGAVVLRMAWDAKRA